MAHAIPSFYLGYYHLFHYYYSVVLAMAPISVNEATAIIQATALTYGIDHVSLKEASGRVLAQNIVAYRPFPPFNRAMMDGIALRYSDIVDGQTSFIITDVLAAGQPPMAHVPQNKCIEIMTGAMLPADVDTVIRYEDITVAGGVATVLVPPTSLGQHVHLLGADVQAGTILVSSGTIINSAIIAIAATEGYSSIQVYAQPSILIVATGSELVSIDEEPQPWQIRMSNGYTIQSLLAQHQFKADIVHVPDNKQQLFNQLQSFINMYDVVVLTGGVSLGKQDYIPAILASLGVVQHFHKVKQKPGKPIWFGTHVGKPIFAFPGNPVSCFVCVLRYLLPWLHKATGLPQMPQPFAAISTDINFTPALQYFVPARVVNQLGSLIATPFLGNGSGDFANLTHANAFIELPEEQSNFSAGTVYPVWFY